MAGPAGELGFAVLLGFFFVSAHMLLEISMERVERLWMHYLGVDEGGRPLGEL